VPLLSNNQSGFGFEGLEGAFQSVALDMLFFVDSVDQFVLGNNVASAGRRYEAA
jgi:hypothetical protein